MRELLTKLAAAASALSGVAQAGFFFNDIRPKSYKEGKTLDIHVSNLFSPQTLTTHDMYHLNYCQSTASHEYSDDNAEDL